jgi:hypothetical protein
MYVGEESNKARGMAHRSEPFNTGPCAAGLVKSPGASLHIYKSHSVSAGCRRGGNEKINVTTTGHATLTHFLVVLLLLGGNIIMKNSFPALHLFLGFSWGPTHRITTNINQWIFFDLFLLFSQADGEDQRMGHTNQLKTRLVLSFFFLF